MARRERRAEMRQISKELALLKQDPIYLNLLHDDSLAKVVQENLVFLEKGEYIDKDIQLKYGKVINFLQTVNQLQYRLKALRGEVE
jgi:hypothetical protein